MQSSTLTSSTDYQTKNLSPGRRNVNGISTGKCQKNTRTLWPFSSSDNGAEAPRGLWLTAGRKHVFALLKTCRSDTGSSTTGCHLATAAFLRCSTGGQEQGVSLAIHPRPLIKYTWKTEHYHGGLQKNEACAVSLRQTSKTHAPLICGWKLAVVHTQQGLKKNAYLAVSSVRLFGFALCLFSVYPSLERELIKSLRLNLDFGISYRQKGLKKALNSELFWVEVPLGNFGCLMGKAL